MVKLRVQAAGLSSVDIVSLMNYCCNPNFLTSQQNETPRHHAGLISSDGGFGRFGLKARYVFY
jgi:hypothetical protein